jgi:hypothetical protein
MMVGKTIKTSTGSWTGTTPMSFTYQWRRCDASGAACVDVPGANGSKYTLVTADGGRTMRVVVTAQTSSVQLGHVLRELGDQAARLTGSGFRTHKTILVMIRRVIDA